MFRRQLLVALFSGFVLVVPAVGSAVASPLGGGEPAPPAAAAGTDPVIAAAGDIACGAGDANYNGGNGTATACRQKYTSNLLVDGGYSDVLTLGDNMQSDPSPTGFATVFNSTWGRVKGLIHPEAGNHDYGYSGAKGYYGYFGAAAGDPTKGYYSYDIGAWHVVALNSNCTKIVGGCASGGAQDVWLRADLASHAGRCLLAVDHHARYSSGHDGDNTVMTALYQDLLDAHADVLLSGHSHDYERFLPQDNASRLDTANGITQFVVGTGGAFFTGLGTRHANSAASQNSTFGVLALSLHSSSYDWRFVPEAGKTWTDTGTRSCHASAPPPADDFAVSANPSTVSVQPGQTTTSTISTTLTGGSAQDITLSASGLPAGTTVSFNPTTITTGSTSTMTITTSATTPTGTQTLTVTGTGPSITHTTAVTLSVTPPPPADNFAVNANPSTVSVQPGQTTTSTISTTLTGGSAQDITLTASGQPAGTTVTFNPTTITTGSTATMTITTIAATPTGTVTLTVTGTGPSITHTAALTLVVTSGTPTRPLLVQSAGATETAAATALTARLPAASAAGHLLVALAGVYTGTSNRITSVTDSAGNVWTRAGTWAVSGHNSDGEIWFAANARSASTIVTHTASAAVVALDVMDFSGVATAGPLDAVSGAANTGTAPASGPVTPATSGELMVGLIAGHASAQAMTMTTVGVTASGQQTSVAGSTTSVLGGYLVPGIAGPVSITGRFAGAMYWTAGVAAFRAATG